MEPNEIETIQVDLSACVLPAEETNPMALGLINELLAENARLRTVVDRYADPNNWFLHYDSVYGSLEDGGDVWVGKGPRGFTEAAKAAKEKT